MSVLTQRSTLPESVGMSFIHEGLLEYFAKEDARWSKLFVAVGGKQSSARKGTVTEDDFLHLSPSEWKAT